MSSNVVHVVDVDVGVPSMETSRQQCLKVLLHFHGFVDLDSDRGSFVQSPPFYCKFGHLWHVKLYPGGAKKSSAQDGVVSVYLVHKKSVSSIDINHDMLVRNDEGKIIKEKKDTRGHAFDGDSSHGWTRFIKRSRLQEPGNLSNGTLTIELTMKLKSQVNFIPKNPFGKLMLKMFLDEDTADVLFVVSGERYNAHRVVLKACAPDLHRLCEEYDESTPVIIPDVEPRVFKMLLKYVYGGKVDADWKIDAKKYLDTADKYGITGLKVMAEALYVTHRTFSVDDAIEDLLYADAKKCPLLREAAMNFILENAKEVIGSDSFDNALDAKEIAKEIMLRMLKAQGKDNSRDVSGDFMSINALRMALYEHGLDVDGSRELLTSRLSLKNSSFWLDALSIATK